MSKVHSLLGLTAVNPYRKELTSLSKWLLAVATLVLVAHQGHAQVEASVFFNISENTEGTFYSVEGTDDADLSRAVFTINEGLDGDLFQVAAKGGEVRFKVAPDYESPQDVDRDNTYELQLLVKLNNEVLTHDIVFRVLNLSDEPDIISQPVTRVLEAEDYYYQLELAEERPVNITTTDLPEWLTLTNQGEVEDLIDFAEISIDDQGNPITLGNAARTAIDDEGNLYINNFESVYKYSREGVITFIAGFGTGFTDGTGSDAQFGRGISGMVLDADRNIYLSDNFNHSIRKITPNGVMTTVMGDGNAGTGMGTNGLERLDDPNGVDVDAEGNIYIADGGNDRIVRINTSGQLELVATGFDGPKSIAIDRDNGTVFVADTGNSLIKKVTPDGSISVFAGGGRSHRDNGTSVGTEANFSGVDDMVIDQHKNLYVVSGRSIRKVTPEAEMTNLIGKTERASNVNNATSRGVDYIFSSLLDLTVDHLGNLYITDDGLKRASIFAKVSGDASGQLGIHAVALTSTAENDETFDQTFNITVSEEDTTAPLVVNVSSPDFDGNYVFGDELEIFIQFDETVFVTGTPVLELVDHDKVYEATYISGSGSNTLTFNYVVRGGHITGDQAYNGTEALKLNGGTIVDAAGLAANLTLPQPGEHGSLSANKDLAISGTPSVTMSIGPESVTSEADGTPENLIFELSHPSERIVALTFSVSGTAIENEDYILPASAQDKTVEIDPGNTRIEVPISIVADGLTESDEYIVVDLSSSLSGIIAGSQRVILSIQESGPPVLVNSNPLDNEIGFNQPTISFTYSQEIVKGRGRISVMDASTDIEVFGAGINSPLVSIAGNTATLELVSGLPVDRAFYIRMQQGAFVGTTGFKVAGVLDPEVLNFSNFLTPTLFQSNPTDDSDDFSATQIELVFFDNMKKGFGRISIRDMADDSEIAGVGMANDRISIVNNTVIIDLVNPLPANKEVYLHIPATALKSELGFNFGGILDKNTLNFATPTSPELISTEPMDGMSDFEGTQLTFTFDKTVTAGRGRITIHNSADDEVILSVGVNSTGVSIMGSVVTLDLRRPLPLSTAAYVNIPPMAFRAESGLFYTGISDQETLNFVTGSEPSTVNVGERLTINENIGEPLVKLFPNPANDLITVDVSQFENIDALQIISINGVVKLDKANVTTDSLNVDVSNYRDGIYLLRVSGQDGTVVYKKLMVRH